MMKKIIVAMCLMPGIGFAAAAAGGGAAAAAGMMAASNAARSEAMRQAEASKHPADCASCHRELFPFDMPDTCTISSDPFNCWTQRWVEGNTRIMIRNAGKVRRVYRLSMKYGQDRIFMPASSEIENPHYVLEER